MHQPPFVALSFSIFLVSFFVGTLSRDVVSPETLLAEHRALFQVKQGMSSDRNLILFQNNTAALAPLYRVEMNHLRNLRVWSRASDDGMETVFFVEQVRPRQTFEVRGNFLVSPESVHLTWTTPETFLFCGADRSGVTRWFAVHLREGVLLPLSSRGRCVEETVRSVGNQKVNHLD